MKTTERSQIEMVEVSMRKKNKIDLWQLVKLERGRSQPLRTDGEPREANSDTREERGIGENFDTEKIDEHRRMTEPGKRDPRIAPL